MKGRRQHQIMLRSPVQVTSQKSTTPCAACKLLRRKCTLDCPFSHYFSPYEPQKFASVHKVFGASNVSKMLKVVPEAQRMDTANSLIYEASMRLRDPVYGCMSTILSLQRQIQSLQAELVAIKSEIIEYKFVQEANDLVRITTTNHVSNNFNISQYHSSLADVVASLELPLPHPQSLASPATSIAHLTDHTMLITEDGGEGYIGRYFH